MGYGDGISSKISIPKEVNGIPVTAIGQKAFEECEAVSYTHLGKKQAFFVIANLYKYSMVNLK